jgi:hypothetical protein
MKDAIRVAGLAAFVALVLVPTAALAGGVAPELDPGIGVAGLALLGGTTFFVIERYRRRAK